MPVGPRGKVAQQARRNAPERVLSVAVAAIRLSEDRESDPCVAGLEERDLVVDRPGSASPAALEVEMPAREPEPPDPPALARNDVGELMAGKGAVPRRDEAVESIHEPRLVPGTRAAQAPDRVVVKAVHPGAV